MPVSKVDARCFTLSQRVDGFLSLSNANRTDLTPPDFWKEVVQSEEAVSSYIVCLIVKLIALDSDHGLKPLPVVYKDLVEMTVDHSKYKQWSAKPLPANCKTTAVELQYAIITTIRHLKDCYGYAPNIHLRHMYLRWNLARNYLDGGKKADAFEEKVITPFSVAQAKEIICTPYSSPLRKSLSLSSSGIPLTCLSPEEEESSLVCKLVDECCGNHRRAFFGALPPDQCRLCSHTSATDSLLYIRLRDLTSRSPQLLEVAMSHVLMSLNGLVSHTPDNGEKEVLLPLLHLFREFLIMMCPVDTVAVYQSVMPFYMWPLSHSQFTRGVLDQIMQEERVRGTNYRRRVLAEQELGLKSSEKKVQSHLTHMLVDTSHPLSRGSLLHNIFTTHQLKSDQQSLHRLITRNVITSVNSDMDAFELEAKLSHLSSDSLKSFCIRSLDMVEKVAAGEDDITLLKEEMDKMYKEMVQHAESDEQRDSAVSCSSMDSNLRFSDNRLSSSPMPEPFIHMHSLDNTQYQTVLTKMKDILLSYRQKLSPGEKGFSQSLSQIEDQLSMAVESSPKLNTLSIATSSSHTSLDSTGSSGLLEQDKPGPDQAKLTMGNGDDGKSKSCGEDSGLTNGHQMNGVVDNHMNGYQNHIASTPRSKTGSPIPSEVVNSDEITKCISIHSLNNHELHHLVNCKNDDNSSKQSVDTNPSSCDMMSITSGEDRVSESGSAQDPVSSTILSLAHLRTNIPSSNSRFLDRRQTCPTGMQRMNRRPSHLRFANNSSASFTSSCLKRYTNVSGQPVGGRSNLTSIKVKIRRNPSRTSNSSVKRKAGRRPSVSIVPNNPASKLLKVVLAGNDYLVSQAAKAYAYLQVEEPNLLSGIELKFYHVPLSRASLLHAHFPELSPSTNVSTNVMHGGGGGGYSSELPEPMFEQLDCSGNDVHIGRFLAHMDSWYERNLMMAVHHLLRLLPSDLPSNASLSPDQEVIQCPSSPTSTSITVGEATQASRTSLLPSRVLIKAIAIYTREANNCIHINMYRLRLSIKNEKSHKIEHREIYVLHHVHIQRLSGRKANRQVKPFDANINLTQLSLDGSLIQSDMMEMKDVWLIHASNVPRAGDSSMPNPESDSFELSILRAQDDGRFGSSKFRALEESQYHVCDISIETRDKPFTVMVDTDTDVLFENVVRLEMLPAYKNQSSLSKPTKCNGQMIQLPLMTYWPVDL